MNEQQLLEQAFNSIKTICEDKVDMESKIQKLLDEVTGFAELGSLINPNWIKTELSSILKQFSKKQ